MTQHVFALGGYFRRAILDFFDLTWLTFGGFGREVAVD